MSFIETSLFSKIRKRFLDDEQFRLLQASLMTSPDAGLVIKGSGGIRKLRWGARSSGKRGGLRIIYYRRRSLDQIFLLTVYSKTEVSDLSDKELRLLRSLVRDIERKTKG